MSHMPSETEQLYASREELLRKIEWLESETASAKERSDQDYLRFLAALRQSLDQRINDLDRKIDASITADVAVNTVETIAAKLEGDLEKIREISSDPRPIASLEKQIAALTEISSQTIQQLKVASLMNNIEPRLSVLRPNVKLVDANLAYKYADLQSDTNILIGLTTLFLGAGISAAVSWVISLATARAASTNSSDSTVIAVYAAITGMSVLITIILGFMTIRAWRKANEARKSLESRADEQDVNLNLNNSSNGVQS